MDEMKGDGMWDKVDQSAYGLDIYDDMEEDSIRYSGSADGLYVSFNVYILLPFCFYFLLKVVSLLVHEELAEAIFTLLYIHTLYVHVISVRHNWFS